MLESLILLYKKFLLLFKPAKSNFDVDFYDSYETEIAFNGISNAKDIDTNLLDEDEDREEDKK